MTARSLVLTEEAAWKARERHQQEVGRVHLPALFDDDPGRGQRLTAEAVGLYLDYSKNRITSKTLRLLLELAEQSDLQAQIDAMFRGEKINVSEDRAVLHVALRAPREAFIMVGGDNVEPQVHAGKRRKRDRPPLPAVGGPFREGPCIVKVKEEVG